MRNLTNEIAHSATNFTAGTYAVKDTIQLSSNLVIPENETLIFQGGKFEAAEGCKENFTITGSRTCLVAPISTIFGKRIKVEGTWNIDRVYPQWFELEEDNDWSTAINKTIKMKNTGEVFLPAGQYEIDSPIIMNKGIQLVGENSQAMGETETYTIISPIVNGAGNFNGEYLLYANSYTTPENFQYIDQATIIRNIYFRNREESLPAQKCILAGGGVHFDRVVWYNFLLAVKYTGTYNDTKSITNCSFKTIAKNDTSDEYAFDMCWLGDALRINNENVECFTKKVGGIIPTAGWKRGDIIYNIGATPSISVVSDDII